MLQSVDDDDVGRYQTLLHHPQSVDAHTQGNRPVLESAVGLQDQHEFLAEVIADSTLVDEYGVVAVIGDQLDACEQTGSEAAVLVVEDRAGMNGAAARVDLIVDEIQHAFVRKTLFADQAHEHRTRGGAVSAPLGRRAIALPHLRKSQIGRFIRIEIRVHRVVGDHGGQQIDIGYEIARRDERARHMAVDGRAHVRILEIQARRVQLRVQGTQVPRRLGLRRRQLLVLLACDCVLGIQPLGARMPGCRIIELRLCPLEFSIEPLDLDLKRAGVDLKQQLSFADSGTLHELHGVDEPADPRPHFDRIDRLQLPRELIPVVQGPGNHFGDRDRRRWRCSIRRRLGLGMAACGEYGRANSR